MAPKKRVENKRPCPDDTGIFDGQRVGDNPVHWATEKGFKDHLFVKEQVVDIKSVSEVNEGYARVFEKFKARNWTKILTPSGKVSPRIVRFLYASLQLEHIRIGSDCGLRLLEDLGARRWYLIGFIAGVGFYGGGVAWVVAMAAVLRLGFSMIRVACLRDAVIGASGGYPVYTAGLTVFVFQSLGSCSHPLIIFSYLIGIAYINNSTSADPREVQGFLNRVKIEGGSKMDTIIPSHPFRSVGWLFQVLAATVVILGDFWVYCVEGLISRVCDGGLILGFVIVVIVELRSGDYFRCWIVSCGLGFTIVAGIGFDCELRLFKDLGVRRWRLVGFIAGVGLYGGGVVWVVAMAAVLRLGFSMIRVAYPRDAVIGASGCLLGLILLEHCIGLQTSFIFLNNLIIILICSDGATESQVGIYVSFGCHTLWQEVFPNDPGDTKTEKLDASNCHKSASHLPHVLPSKPAPLAKHIGSSRSAVQPHELIQISFSFSDKNGNTPPVSTYQFNFNDFDPRKDAYFSASIDLLTRNGIDMENNLREGVDPGIFSGWLTQILIHNSNMKWITFHGFYDLGYLVKSLMRNIPLPSSLGDFLKGVRVTLRNVYDVKYMSQFCNGLFGGKLGLERLGSIINVKRVGISHQAGSDSLLTLSLFLKMREQFNMIEERYEGFLDGIDMKIPVLIF
ncbi:hypothetical protein GIB67_028113 [Kingdonia uniflora]|uniref:Uncharacterized protein n=1 Tax=Kingdonia uniflora TaxID=39325 RepID=A0A7J7NRH2_9MAGN|nr:hypothetical protein GIB67_028113 [Kingdonia uniflora]